MFENSLRSMFANESSDTFVEYVLEFIQEKGGHIEGLVLGKSHFNSAGAARDWVEANDIPIDSRVHSSTQGYSFGVSGTDGGMTDIEYIPIRSGVNAWVAFGNSATISEQPPAQEPMTMRHTFKSEHVDYDVEEYPLRFTIRAAVEGTIGSAAGSPYQVVYTKSSFQNHTFGEERVLNLNHNPRAKVGELVESFVSNGELYITFDLSQRFAFMAPMLRSGENQGFSIEAYVTEFVETEDEFVFEALSFELSGLAIMLAVPPACPHEICHLVSSKDAEVEQFELTEDVKSMLDEATPDQLRAIQAMIERQHE